MPRVRQRTLSVPSRGGCCSCSIGPPLITTGSGAETGTKIPGLRFMVPNTPGGGYDITARTAAKDAEDAELNHNIEVFNLPGAGGTVGLSRLVNERGNGKLAMSMGLGVVGRRTHQQLPLDTGRRHTDRAHRGGAGHRRGRRRTPSTRRSSSFWPTGRRTPASCRSAAAPRPGGPDHLAPMLMAQAAGIAPKSVNYVPFDGGGELLASVLGGKVAFGVSGIGEYRDQIKSGELRLLAVTGTKRIKGFDAPTLKEAGMDVEFTNWRGIMAPPGLSDGAARQARPLLRRAAPLPAVAEVAAAERLGRRVSDRREVRRLPRRTGQARRDRC